jgi:hypothetical protein
MKRLLVIVVGEVEQVRFGSARLMLNPLRKDRLSPQ